MDMQDVQNYFLRMFSMPVKSIEITLDDIEKEIKSEINESLEDINDYKSEIKDINK